ncbi:uncharacterized protein si:dkeyp-75h12.7 isoform X2 [Oncorhynchus masou masou]|uniref:uncharacterized protein si:dkeyp-75h12.7 isoform X2 n=1 Tax=Oncorhynchus masou masou TaxID=90313 RepID=UPI0031836BD6
MVYGAEFSNLVPGHDYCVVANFSVSPATFPQASSPPSDPSCVHHAGPGLGLQRVLLGIGVCAVLFSPLLALALYLLKQKRDAPHASLQAFLKDLPESPSDPVDPSDIVDDHLSILSSFSSCVCTEAQAPSLGNGYNSSPFLSD